MPGFRRSTRTAIALSAPLLAATVADRALADSRTILPPPACATFADTPHVAALARYVYVFGAGRSSLAAGQDADLVPAAVRRTEPAETWPEATREPVLR
jgi:hypothetical protein